MCEIPKSGYHLWEYLFRLPRTQKLNSGATLHEGWKLGESLWRSCSESGVQSQRWDLCSDPSRIKGSIQIVVVIGWVSSGRVLGSLCIFILSLSQSWKVGELSSFNSEKKETQRYVILSKIIWQGNNWAGMLETVPFVHNMGFITNSCHLPRSYWILATMLELFLCIILFKYSHNSWGMYVCIIIPTLQKSKSRLRKAQLFVRGSQLIKDWNPTFLARRPMPFPTVLSCHPPVEASWERDYVTLCVLAIS